MNVHQRRYIKNITEESRKSPPIYKYKLDSFNVQKNGNVLVCWIVDPCDTLYEENGVKYILYELVDLNGHVIHQTRIYNAEPLWLSTANVPENIQRPYNVLMN